MTQSEMTAIPDGEPITKKHCIRVYFESDNEVATTIFDRIGTLVSNAAESQRLVRVEYAPQELRDRTEALYADDDVEIDDEAEISTSEDGCFVQAWVWMVKPPDEDEDPAEHEEDLA